MRQLWKQGDRPSLAITAVVKFISRFRETIECTRMITNAIRPLKWNSLILGATKYWIHVVELFSDKFCAACDDVSQQRPFAWSNRVLSDPWWYLPGEPRCSPSRRKYLVSELSCLCRSNTPQAIILRLVNKEPQNRFFVNSTCQKDLTWYISNNRHLWA